MSQQQRQEQAFQQPVESRPADPVSTTGEEQRIREDLERLSGLAARFAVARQVISEKQIISATREEALVVLTKNVQIGGE